MAQMSASSLIPEGWTKEIETRKDGFKIPVYLCPATGQHFYTYDALMRYVRYAQANQLGMYEPSSKSVKRKGIQEKDGATKRRKTATLTPARKPSPNANSSTVGMSLDPTPSTSDDGSTDKGKGPDNSPEAV